MRLLPARLSRPRQLVNFALISLGVVAGLGRVCVCVCVYVCVGGGGSRWSVGVITAQAERGIKGN